MRTYLFPFDSEKKWRIFQMIEMLCDRGYSCEISPRPGFLWAVTVIEDSMSLRIMQAAVEEGWCTPAK